ncbi:hypothetical protein [Jiangella anatolica]|nr:hypothetical protein [Jiangella anatolica]
MGAMLVVTVLLLAALVASGLWTVRYGDVRPQPDRFDYDSRRPLP